MRPILAAAALAVSLAFAGAVQAGAPTPKKPVVIDRFLGRWYEVARMPNKPQKNCFSPTATWSKGADGKISVVNVCRKGSHTGPEQVFKGNATILDASAGKVLCSFLGGIVKQEYWVLDRADDYSWAILGTPGGNFVWAFSRKPLLSPAEKTALLNRVKALGFNVAKLELAGR